MKQKCKPFSCWLTWLVVCMQVIALLGTTTVGIIQPTPGIAQTTGQQADMGDWLARVARRVTADGQWFWGTPATTAAQAARTASAPAANKPAPTQFLQSGETPRGLSTNDWASIQQQMANRQYRAYADASSGGYIAANPAQGFQSAYGTDGTVTLTSHDQAMDWHVALRLAGIGYTTDLSAIPLTQTKPDMIAAALTTGGKVTYQWSETLHEWWVNDEKGLEQWFRIDAPPAGRTGEEWLRVALALKTDMTARLEGADQLLLEKAGVSLRYDKLKVWDANGQVLDTHMELAGSRLTLVVNDSRAIYPITIDPIFLQQAYIKASNTGADDNFGHSVAIDGDTVVVGAPFEDSSATGVNGSQSSNAATDAGAVYVFVRNSGVWSQQAYLKASNTGANDQFGFAVAISGNTIVVGASGEDSSATGVGGSQTDNTATDAGAAYVFIRSGTTWSQQAYLKASNTGAGDEFGDSVTIDGDTVVVGAHLEDSSATGINGSQSSNAAADAGAAYVFTRSGTTWSQQAYLKASNTGGADDFGTAVAISGDIAVVGAQFEDSSAPGVNGNQADNTDADAGAAYVFVRSGTTWSQQAYLKASSPDADDRFGHSVAIDGTTVVVGARMEDGGSTGVNGNSADNSTVDSGAAYVFVSNGTTWSQQAYLKAAVLGTYDDFGFSVGISGDVVIVGALWEDSSATGSNGSDTDRAVIGSGAAYIFVRVGTVWSQQTFLKASNTGYDYQFGFAVALSGDTAVSGSRREYSSATGINGNQANTSATNAGAAYVFTRFDPVLVIGKSAPATATQGVNFNYTLVVTNTGTYTTSGVITATDTLPAGLSFVSGSGGGFSCSAAGQVVTCTSSTAIAINGTATISLAVNPSSTGNVSNSATVTGGGATNPAASNTVNTTVNVPLPPLIVPVKVFLGGAYDSTSGLMRDDLRSQNLLPTTSPYNGLAGTTTASVLAVTGNNAIVDWVLVELRDPTTPATVSASKVALVQRDGDVVDVDGVSPLSFTSLSGSSYYVAVKHRNHLGVMTSAPVALSSSTPVVDFTVPATAVYGTNARRTVGSVSVLWAGNVNGDKNVIAAGPNNDQNPLIATVLGAPGNTSYNRNYVVSGYNAGDVNLDGKVIASGPNNDINIILYQIFSYPGNTALAANYILPEQLP